MVYVDNREVVFCFSQYILQIKLKHISLYFVHFHTYQKNFYTTWRK